MNYNNLLNSMIENQIIARGINDGRVINAILKVPRQEFVPEENKKYAYQDSPLSIGFNQTISQPYIVALMTQLLLLTGSEKVLEIGTGSGYQTAILSKLSSYIYTIERIAELSQFAQQILSKLGFANISFKVGDGTEGWPENSPYDRIIVTAASKNIPQPFIEQLRKNGKIVIPLGDSFHQTLTVAEKIAENKIIKKEITGCVFVPLIGKYAWEK